MKRREFLKTALAVSAAAVFPKTACSGLLKGMKPAKRIVVLSAGSASFGRTKELIDAFTRGARSKGHEVKCFDLDCARKEPFSGLQREEKIRSEYSAADIVALAFPVYGVSVRPESAFERLFATELFDGRSQKECVLLMAAENNGKNGRGEKRLKHIKQENLFSGGIIKTGAISGRNAANLAETLGKSL